MLLKNWLKCFFQTESLFIHALLSSSFHGLVENVAKVLSLSESFQNLRDLYPGVNNKIRHSEKYLFVVIIWYSGSFLICKPIQRVIPNLIICRTKKVLLTFPLQFHISNDYANEANACDSKHLHKHRVRSAGTLLSCENGLERVWVVQKSTKVLFEGGKLRWIWKYTCHL